LATRAADFDVLSTLILQLHPDISEGLRRLHEIVVPLPQWARSWSLVVFMMLGTASVAVARRAWLALTVMATLIYFLFFDTTMTSNHFRVYVVLFPVFAYAVALAADRLRRNRWLGLLLAAAFVLAGATSFKPPQMVPVDMTAPPEGMIGNQTYLVNSGFYHPEALVRRFPESRFLGLPIQADQVEAFLSVYPSVETVLWHGFSIQDEVKSALLARKGTSLIKSGHNRFDYPYEVYALARATDGESP
jgi:hypothetical protein